MIIVTVFVIVVSVVVVVVLNRGSSRLSMHTSRSRTVLGVVVVCSLLHVSFDMVACFRLNLGRFQPTHPREALAHNSGASVHNRGLSPEGFSRDDGFS